MILNKQHVCTWIGLIYYFIAPFKARSSKVLHIYDEIYVRKNYTSTYSDVKKYLLSSWFVCFFWGGAFKVVFATAGHSPNHTHIHINLTKKLYMNVVKTTLT